MNIIEDTRSSMEVPIRMNSRQVAHPRPTIGLLIHNVARLGQTILWGIVDAAQEQDVNVLCFEGRELCIPANRAQGNVLYELVPETIDGLIFYGSGSFDYVSHAEFTRFCHRYRPCPMVTIGGKVVEDVLNVTIDNREGMSRVVTHLIQSHGCRRIAYIHGKGGEAPFRYQGYVDALTEHGIPLDPALVIGHNANPGIVKAGSMAITELLDERRLSPPDDVEAIMAVNDTLAIGAINALQQRGFRVPDDVAVAGFDDHPRAVITTPPLTTVRLPFYDTARQAVDLILRRLRGEEVPTVVEVPAPLIVRESCGCYSSSVSMAAAPRSPAHAVLRDRPLRAVRAEEIIAEMERAPVFSDQTRASDWMRRLVEGLLAELRGDSPGIFLNTLRQIVTTMVRSATDAAQEVAVLHNVITRLRHALFPYDETSSSERAQAEHLWQQARIVIGEAQGRVRAQRAFDVEQHTEVVQDFGKSLITTFDMQGLKEVLAQGLPALGIQSCALALYEDPQPYAYPQPAPEWSQVLLAYDEQGQRDVTSPACRFRSRHFFPPHLLPHHRRSTLLVEALYFLDQQIGFMTLEMGPRKGSVYSLLRSQISSALQGALLVDRIRERTAEIERQKYILDTFMTNVPDSIYFKDRESRIIRSNQSHAASFGFSDPDELLGKSDFDLFPQEQAQPKYDQEQTIMRTGEPILAKEEPKAGGRWALTTKMPLRDEHGAIIGTFGISRDITALKRAQEELQKHAHELAAAYEEIHILNTQLQEENLRMSAELDVSRRIQQMMLPSPQELLQIPGLDIVGYMQPADEVGGDYYDVLRGNKGLHIGIGDVTGHGLESGLLMLMTQTTIRTLLEHGETDPAAFVTTLNRTIYQNVQRMGVNKTLTFVLLHYQDGLLKVVGQHEEILVVRAGGRIERLDTMDLGFPVGLEEEIQHWVQEASISLAPGDGVVLYTDGITEAANLANDLYGIERLCEVVSQHWEASADAIKQAVIDDVTRHIGDQKVYDDLTLVVLKHVG